jgi:hypothetical protein
MVFDSGSVPVGAKQFFGVVFVIAVGVCVLESIIQVFKRQSTAAKTTQKTEVNPMMNQGGTIETLPLPAQLAQPNDKNESANAIA